MQTWGWDLRCEIDDMILLRNPSRHLEGIAPAALEDDWAAALCCDIWVLKSSHMNLTLIGVF